MKALVFLSSKSIEIRQVDTQPKQKEDMAEVEDDGGAICDDENDDLEVDLDSDDDDESDWGESDDEDGGVELYNSPLDSVDEVIHFHT